MQTISIPASAVDHLEPLPDEVITHLWYQTLVFLLKKFPATLWQTFGIFSRRNCTSLYSCTLTFLRVLSTRSGVTPSSAHKSSSQRKLQWNKEAFAIVFLPALTTKYSTSKLDWPALFRSMQDQLGMLQAEFIQLKDTSVSKASLHDTCNRRSSPSPSI